MKTYQNKMYSSQSYNLNQVSDNSKSKKIFIIHCVIVLIFITYIFYIFNNKIYKLSTDFDNNNVNIDYLNNKISLLSRELDEMKFIVSFLMKSNQMVCSQPGSIEDCHWNSHQLYIKYPHILNKFIKAQGRNRI